MQRMEIDLIFRSLTLIEENITLKISIGDDFQWIYAFKNKKHFLVFAIRPVDIGIEKHVLEVFDFKGNSLGLIRINFVKISNINIKNLVKRYYKRLRI